MKFVYFNIMCLFVWSYCDACELNGEECTCDYLVYLTLKIRCLKKSNLEKVLTFEPFPYYENKYILNIELTIQNKVYTVSIITRKMKVNKKMKQYSKVECYFILNYMENHY